MKTLAFLTFPSTAGLIFILCVVLLIFGPKKLPELARSIGISAREFKDGLEKLNSPSDDANSRHSNQKEDRISDGTPSPRQNQSPVKPE